MKHWRVLLGVFVALATVRTDAAGGPVRLTPSSDWVLDYADERCGLSRGFGSGAQSATLRIDSYGSWREYRVLVAGSAVPKLNTATSPLSLRLTPDQQEVRTSALNGEIERLPATSFSLVFAPYEKPKPARSERELYSRNAAPRSFDGDYEKQVNSIWLRFYNGKTLELDLGDMAKPLEAMRSCVDDLYKSWGLEPAVQRSISRRPVIKVDTVHAVQRKYPTNMLQNGTRAFVPVRVMVNSQGKVTACVDQVGWAPDEFMQAACAGIEAGSFEPALDATGNPVDSVYNTSVFYF